MSGFGETYSREKSGAPFLLNRSILHLVFNMRLHTQEEIRETFNLPDDLTAEEKLAPIDFATDDSRVRLLNQLYAKKRWVVQTVLCMDARPRHPIYVPLGRNW